jgi:segregation and condensation protein B
MEPDKKEVQQKQIITEETAKELDNLFDEREQESEEKVEAAFFISAKFLSVQDLIVLTDINPIMLKEILHKLERKYSLGAIRLIKRGNSWKMDVAEKYHYLINRLATGTAEFTKSEQETLAVIAYKQPIKQSVIIKIRGNKSYEHIKKFRELGLISAKKIGHTHELNLSDDFYEYFNVQKKEGQDKENEKQEDE